MRDAGRHGVKSCNATPGSALPSLCALPSPCRFPRRCFPASKLGTRLGGMSGAIRVFLFGLLAFCGVLSGAAVAGMQPGPLDTVTSVLSSVGSQTTVVPDLTDTGVTETAVGGSVGSGASGALSAVSPGSSQARFHSRFDRLPRRYEVLLERIELGRNVRASIARLRALLASASPRLRARLVRLIRMEIRRLEQGGLTKRERAAVQRLRRLLIKFERQFLPSAGGVSGSLGRLSDAGIASATAGGAGGSAARAGSQSPPGGPPLLSERERADDPTPEGLLPSPISPTNPLYWLLLLLLLVAAIGLLLLLLSLAPRSSLRRRELRLLALTVVVAGVLGLGVVVLLA